MYATDVDGSNMLTPRCLHLFILHISLLSVMPTCSCQRMIHGFHCLPKLVWWIVCSMPCKKSRDNRFRSSNSEESTTASILVPASSTTTSCLEEDEDVNKKWRPSAVQTTDHSKEGSFCTSSSSLIATFCLNLQFEDVSRTGRIGVPCCFSWKLQCGRVHPCARRAQTKLRVLGRSWSGQIG